MDFVTLLASGAPELTNWIGKFLYWIYQGVGNFGWAVIIFTISVKLIVSPIDIWQKIATRKQNKAMQRIQPQMAKLQKQYANRPDLLKEAQAKLYKQEKISFFSSCIPMLLTFAVFFIVFSGFRAVVRYENEMIVYNIWLEYDAYIQLHGVAPSNEFLAGLYQPEGWLWIKNLFMPDSWANIIPDFGKFVSTGLGGIGGALPDAISLENAYNTLIGPAMEQYNGSRWNGFMILPLLSIVTTFFSTKFMQSSTPQTPSTGNEQTDKMQKSTMKGMMFIMPIMIGVFSLFYSAAFSLYLFISNLFTTAFNLTFNIITKRKDKQEAEKQMATTFRR